MDGLLIFFVVFLLILVVLQVFIYGYGCKRILSSANLNTDFSIILGFILGPVWMIISLIRVNHFNLKNIKLIVLRFIVLSIVYQILIELSGGVSPEKMVYQGLPPFVAFLPFVLWFFIIPYSLIGEKLFDINLENFFSRSKITEGPQKNNGKHNSDLRSSDVLSKLGDKINQIDELFSDLFDFLSSDDDIASRNKKETERVLKIKNEKPKPLSKMGIDKLKINSRKKSYDQAIDELKKLKELLDLGLISQEDFDNKSKELKKIILNN